MDVRRMWGQSFVLALISAAVLFVAIVGLGNVLLFLHGTAAVIAGISVMALIIVVAHLIARTDESPSA